MWGCLEILCGNQSRFIKSCTISSCVSSLFGCLVSELVESPAPNHEMLSPHSTCALHWPPHISPSQGAKIIATEGGIYLPPGIVILHTLRQAYTMFGKYSTRQHHQSLTLSCWAISSPSCLETYTQYTVQYSKPVSRVPAI